MIIKDIPESVFKRALDLRGLDTSKSLPEGWSWELEYHHIEDRSMFSDGELEMSISEYLTGGGDWGSQR